MTYICVGLLQRDFHTGTTSFSHFDKLHKQKEATEAGKVRKTVSENVKTVTVQSPHRRF